MPEQRADKRWMVAALVVGFFMIGLLLMLVTGVLSR